MSVPEHDSSDAAPPRGSAGVHGVPFDRTRDERASVLVVEDDDAFASLITESLTRRRATTVHTARGVAEASSVLRQRSFDLVLIDRGLPDGDGLAAIRAFAASGMDTPFLLLTADASASSAVEAIKAGALDYLVKGPDALERLDRIADAFLSTRARPAPGRGAASLVGDGAAMESVRVLLRRYAPSRACVLIEGETGVGKELVARALHVESRRASGPFVPINCGALPEHLVESELFGHVRGAFTGAHRDHAGLVEHAERGTLFLDEVEDLPLGLQGKLLRLLQEAEYRPVGATRARRADVRVVAASNAELHAMVEEKRFRRDLFYRLNVLRIVVPPLRARLEDLPALLAHLAATRGSVGEGAAPRFVGPAPEALAALREHAWPGNVRELANLVERAAVVAASSGWSAGWSVAVAQLRAGTSSRVASALPSATLASPAWRDAPPSAPPSGLVTRTSSAEHERATLLRLLERHRWRREAAARELGISRVTLWRRMRRAGLHDAATARGPDAGDGADGADV